MFRDAFAYLFRSVNSRLTAANNFIYRKALKLSFIFSISVLRSGWGRSQQETNDFLTIDNFDTDIKMKINRARYIGAAIYWTGFHESRELFFLHRFLRPEMVFVDVGANQGEYTLFAAKRLAAGKVIAVEPLASMRELLTTNIQLNGFENVSVLACGLSDRPGHLAIYEVDNDNEGLATFFPGANKTKKTFDVELKTLDEVMTQNPVVRVDFIKMDIEGSELKALRGAERTIQRFRPMIMVEINKVTFNAAGYDILEIAQFFEEHKYSAHSVDKNGSLAPCRDLPVMANIIFVPR